MDGIEPASLGRRQIRGHGEGGQLAQGLLEAIQSELQRRRPARERVRGPRRRERCQRIIEDVTTIGRVRHAVRRHQREGLSRGQVVACDGGEHVVLLVVRERGQRFRHRRPDGPVGERGARLWPEQPGELQAAPHPGRLAAAQQRHRPRRQTIVDQRRDDACLVQRGQRARRGVRGQDEPLVVHR
ncbi:MAG: hypothetical protein MUF57_02025 [Gammaproteobacteria bacterium]|nr:hypothetical protein [Gammaproteobacteria bacterium]